MHLPACTDGHTAKQGTQERNPKRIIIIIISLRFSVQNGSCISLFASHNAGLLEWDKQQHTANRLIINPLLEWGVSVALFKPLLEWGVSEALFFVA